MSVDFQSLLSTKADDVKRPPVKPPGTYHGIVNSFKFDKSSKQQTPYVRFEITGVEAGEDVDQDALANNGDPIDLTKWRPTADFFLTPDALFRLKEFIESAGINSSGRTLGELIPELKGTPVSFTCKLVPSEDGQNFFNRVDGLRARS